MGTKLEVTKEDIAERARQAGLPSCYSAWMECEIRKQIAREKLRAAISELPGSRCKEILLAMFDEGFV